MLALLCLVMTCALLFFFVVYQNYKTGRRKKCFLPQQTQFLSTKCDWGTYPNPPLLHSLNPNDLTEARSHQLQPL